MDAERIIDSRSTYRIDEADKCRRDFKAGWYPTNHDGKPGMGCDADFLIRMAGEREVFKHLRLESKPYTFYTGRLRSEPMPPHRGIEPDAFQFSTKIPRPWEKCFSI